MAFSSGIKLWRSGPSRGLFRTSTMSAIPVLSILILLRSVAPTLATEPLIVTVTVTPFKKEAMERQRSPPLECPSSPIPGPLT
uniref:Uncharacterized protein n=1 Tax=Varanus komodoensis TaxID=61221 RepID=A0A8D2J3A5_VARKO